MWAMLAPLRFGVFDTMARHTEPPNIQRLAVVVVMGLGLRATTPLALALDDALGGDGSIENPSGLMLLTQFGIIAIPLHVCSPAGSVLRVSQILSFVGAMVGTRHLAAFVSARLAVRLVAGVADVIGSLPA